MLFIILAAVAFRLDGRPVVSPAPRYYRPDYLPIEDKLGKTAEEAARLGPTIFPVLFAAIVGSALKVFARFSAERSSQKLGILEMLLGSRTVLSTIECQLLLRRLTWLGVTLMFLWSLSPLGGQASLRLLSRDTEILRGNQSVIYSNTLASGLYRRLAWKDSSSLWGMDGASGPYMSNTEFPALQTTLLASMNASPATQAAPQDLWNNVRIPRLSRLSNISADDAGWKSIPAGLTKLDYASMTGVPMSVMWPRGQTISQNLTLQFSVEYSYQEVSCMPVRQQRDDYWWQSMIGEPWVNITNTTITAVERPSFTPGTLSAVNTSQTSMYFSFNHTVYRDTEGNLDLFGNASTSPGNDREVTLFLWSGLNAFSKSDMGVAKCTMKQNLVDARISCRNDNCTADALRPARRLIGADPVVYDIDGEALRAIAMLNPQVLGRSLGSLTSSKTGGSPGKVFLLGSNTPSSDDMKIGYTGFRDDDDLTELSQRFALLLNTCMDYMIHGNKITDPGFDPIIYRSAISGDAYYRMGNISTTQQLRNFVDQTQNLARKINTSRNYALSVAVGETSTPQEIYRCNIVWFVILLVASGVLLIIGLASFVLEKQILAPDTVGFVSSQTCDNPYVPVPPASGLDGLERSRLLFDMEVRIGDVNPDEDIGHVAFAAETDVLAVGTLDRKKKYL
ncbi:Hypothetical protein D9617_1g086770 [Elsinoe fawcettii]|nr:Hypothetical protein D9617_1g086770 [Elsinoe fawcettii]